MATETSKADIDSDATETQLRRDLKALRADLDTLAADVTALGRGQLERVRAGAADLGRAGEEAMDHMDHTVSTAVRQRPVQSLALAFLAGYLFSAVAR